MRQIKSFSGFAGCAARRFGGLSHVWVLVSRPRGMRDGARRIPRAGQAWRNISRLATGTVESIAAPRRFRYCRRPASRSASGGDFPRPRIRDAVPDQDCAAGGGPASSRQKKSPLRRPRRGKKDARFRAPLSCARSPPCQSRPGCSAHRLAHGKSRRGQIGKSTAPGARRKKGAARGNRAGWRKLTSWVRWGKQPPVMLGRQRSWRRRRGY